MCLSSRRARPAPGLLPQAALFPSLPLHGEDQEPRPTPHSGQQQPQEDTCSFALGPVERCLWKTGISAQHWGNPLTSGHLTVQHKPKGTLCPDLAQHRALVLSASESGGKGAWGPGKARGPAQQWGVASMDCECWQDLDFPR